MEPSTPFAAEASERGRANAPETPRESERLSSPTSGGASAQETPQTSAGGALGAEEEEEDEDDDDEEALASDGAESVGKEWHIFQLHFQCRTIHATETKGNCQMKL